MGIKSTTTLTRSEALLRLAARIDNETLGNLLDDLAEEEAKQYGQPCFDNFIVVNDDEAGT